MTDLVPPKSYSNLDKKYHFNDEGGDSNASAGGLDY